MKRYYLIVVPLSVFVLAALLAYFQKSPENRALVEINIQPNNMRLPATEATDVNDVVRRMESRILSHNPPPNRTYDGSQMDYYIRNDLFPGSFEAKYEYAQGWARDAPEEMFDWLLGKNKEAQFEAKILFEAWAQVDHDAAIAAALQIPNQNLRAQALMTSLEILYKTKPTQAKKILLENADLLSNEMSSSIQYSYNLKETWDLINALPSGQQRSHLEAKVLASASRDDLAKDIWARATEAQRKEWLDAGFIPSWGTGSAFDGLRESMRQKAEATGDPIDAAYFIGKYGAEWAGRDLAAALEWTQAHVKGEKKIESIGNLFDISAQKNWENTLRIWQQMPESYLKKDIAETILRATPEDRKDEAKALLKLE